MKLLLDANLSPLIATHLVAAGYESVHVRDAKIERSPDEEILAFADREGFVIVSQDSDFTNLLFFRNASTPSLILLRDIQEVTARGIADLLIDNLGQIAGVLEDGAVVSVMRDRIRIRQLPIG
jgi:predicted nuclease of predicted toxin-antitoxin system